MKFNKITLPGVADDDNRTLNMLLEQLGRKYPRNFLRSCYYDGRHAVRAVGGVIPPPYYQLGIVLGWSAKAVDILARRCNLDAFVWPDGNLADIGGDQVWRDNWLGSEVDQGLIDSLLHGTAFAVTVRGEAGEPVAQIHFKDGLNATGQWNTRTRRLDNLLSITAWNKEGSQPIGLVLYLDGRTITADKDAGRWAVEQTEHPWGVPADPLPYKPRTSRRMGRSRISRTVMSLQDQATRTVIRMEAHSDIYAIPDLWMFGANEAIFKNADGSQKAAWQVVMGRIKGIPDDQEATDPTLARAEAKQFPAASPEPHVMSLKQQAQLFSGETSIPLSSLGVSDMSNPTSADSYIASREDLISEAEGATDDWSPGLRRAFTRALAIANGLSDIPDEWASIDTKWRSPIYLSRAAQADAGMKQLTAAPWLAETDVGLELLGLTDQQITRAMSDRRRAAGRQSLDLIAAQGNAGTGSGNAAQV